MSSSAADRRDFFVSYTGADEDWATWIAEVLEAHGYSTVVQVWDFPAGSNFALRMHEATRNTERTILVLSPDSLDASFPAAEWAAAFVRDPQGNESRLIPVRVRQCDPDGLLAAIRYVDLVGLEEASASEKLVREISGATTPDGRVRAGTAFPGAAAISQSRFPGGLPAIWDVPFRARRFVGRDATLDHLRARRKDRLSAAVCQADAVHGLGGIGKSRVCIEYAHRNADSFDVVWWIRASTTATLISDLARLAKRLGSTEADDQNHAVSALAAKGWLERNPRWLIVFDNAAGPGEIRDWVPAAGQGQTLIASRWSAGWGALAEPVELPVLDRDESIELLCDGSDSHRADADEVASLLGDLPLALEQSAAYVAATGISIRDYIERFRARAAEMLNFGTPLDYDATVATTWSLAMDQLEGDEGACVLMWSVALLAPEEVPRSLFADSDFVLSVFDGDDRLLRVDAAVESLRKFSIVNAHGGSIEMHRLVQSVVRGRLGTEQTKNWNGAAQGLLAGLFPSDVEDPAEWNLCDALLPHGLAVTDWAAAHANETGGTAGLLYALGRYQIWRLELVSAEDLFRGASRVAEVAGLDTFERAAIASELAQVLAERGETAEAGRLMSEAVVAAEQVFGAESIELAGMLRNRGSVRRRANDLDGALDDLRQALKIADRLLDPDDPELTSFIVNLSNAESPENALPMQRRAVDLAAQREPFDPHLLAVSLTNLGNTLRHLGKLDESAEHLSRGVAIYEEAYGPEFPRIAGLLASLGVTLRDQNELERAEEVLRRAIEIEEQAYGLDHPKVAATWVDLADLLQEFDLDGAEAAAVRAVDIAEQSHDAPRELPSPLARLGDIQRVRGELDEAEANLTRALQLVLDRGGPDSPQSAHIRVKLGAVLRAQNRPYEAVRELRVATALLEESGNIAQTTAVLNNLGNALGDIGEPDEAVSVLERCCTLTNALFGDRHPRYASALINLAIAYQAMGDEKQADVAIERAVGIDPSCVG